MLRFGYIKELPTMIKTLDKLQIMMGRIAEEIEKDIEKEEFHRLCLKIYGKGITGIL